jgi:hypothetical protein
VGLHPFVKVTLPFEAAAMDRLEPMCAGESIGRWYWRYLGIETLEYDAIGFAGRLIRLAALAHGRPSIDTRFHFRAENL